MVFLCLSTVFLPSPVHGSEIVLRLSGAIDYPGVLSLRGESHTIDHLCFLGEDAKGNVDVGFLGYLSAAGIPEGEYEITKAHPEEQWPDPTFSRNGALRFEPVSGAARGALATAGKFGLVVHGRDFFPLAVRMTSNPKMVRFFSDQLFAQLSSSWGAFRISNWDMGRLHDFYTRNIVKPETWKMTVEAADPAKIKKTCEPLKVKRKPDE